MHYMHNGQQLIHFLYSVRLTVGWFTLRPYVQSLGICAGLDAARTDTRLSQKRITLYPLLPDAINVPISFTIVDNTLGFLMYSFVEFCLLCVLFNRGGAVRTLCSCF